MTGVGRGGNIPLSESRTGNTWNPLATPLHLPLTPARSPCGTW